MIEYAFTVFFVTVAFLIWLRTDYRRMRERDQQEREEMDRRLDQIDRLMDDLGVRRR